MWTLLCVVNETDSVGAAAPTEQAIHDMATQLRGQFPAADIRVFGPDGSPASIVLD